MTRARRFAIPLVVVIVIGVFVAVTWGPPAPVARKPGTFMFAATGDSPYYPWEELRYRILLRDVAAHDPVWLLHVGDIWWRPCTEAMYLETLAWMNGLPVPVLYTPGDNEWSDCWESGSGGYEPLDRLAELRRIFFADPDSSLGGRRIAVSAQASDPDWPEFVENAAWSREGILFATVHLPGSRNGREAFPGRTPGDDATATRRVEAAAAWARAVFARARDEGAAAVVLAFHADPGLAEPPDDPYRSAYDPFLAVVESEAEAFARPVLLVHGDDHVYTVDRPLTNRATGRHLDNVTRLQVPGSPDVGWVVVEVTPGPEPAFAFHPRIVPGWKYW